MNLKIMNTIVRYLNAHAALIEEHAQGQAGHYSPADAEITLSEAKRRADKVRSIARELRAELKSAVNKVGAR
jgi:hypothetical protein